jgi:transcriptional regulator of acetoin/glycerol metabolism
VNLTHNKSVLTAIERRSPSLLPQSDTGVFPSWLRSVEHGLVPDSVTEPEVLSHPEFLQHHGAIEELSALSCPEIDRLFQRLSGYAQVAMLTDAKGVVVVYRSSAEVLDQCTRLRVIPGSIWTEESQGTTGVSLCLKEQRPLSVIMGEHFATKLASLSCTVAPIFGAGGQLAAVLNVSTLHSTDHAIQGVLRDLVASSSRRIENLFFDRRHQRNRVLRLSFHSDFCDWAAESRIALDANDRIVEATSGAQQMLAAGMGYEGAAGLIGKKLASFARVGDLDGHKDRPSTPINIGAIRIHVRALEPYSSPQSRRNLGDSPDDNPAGTYDHSAAVSSAPGGEVSKEPPSAPAGGVSSMIKGLHLATKLHARGLPLLLCGESGTGKTQLARELHASGPHCAGGFVAINCTAIPHDLIESELFGYRAGAFTGSNKQGSPGRLVTANNGTLFLDEIGDMPIALQGRLLQVLSEGEFVPVGGTETVRVRFALISATLQDLKILVQKGAFREDLYYRLVGATVLLPGLIGRS